MRTKAMLVAVFGVFASGPAVAQDVGGGEAIYQDVCRTCHGPKAQGLASFPKLAGREAEYISNRLKQYRAGETVGYNSPLMMPHAQALSDDDIVNIAAYITTSFN